MTFKSLSNIAGEGFKRFHFKIDGRRRGLRFKEVLYVNAMYLGWNVTTCHNDFSSQMREKCSATWVYNNIIAHSYHNAYLGGRLIEGDLLQIEHRANMFYITEDGHKIGYWRVGKIFSLIYYDKETLRLMTFKDTFYGNTDRFFLENTRIKHALKCRASVFVHKIFKDMFVRHNIENIHTEMFYHAFGTADLGGELVVVKGNDIACYYDEGTYHILENGSPLCESCMRYETCYEHNYFDIYTKNKNCEMLIYKHKSGGIMGRALLWTATDGTETYKIMDRVYYCYESVQPLFFKWASDNNYLRKDRQSYDYYELVKPDGTRVYKDNLWIELDKSEFRHYPYCDTFHLLDVENDELHIGVSEICNDCCEVRNLRCTGGGWEDNEEYVQLDYCDTRARVDDCSWSDVHDCYIHVDDCFYSEYDNSYIFCDNGVYCEDIEEDIFEESAVYSEKDDCHYTREGCVYSEFYESEISVAYVVQDINGDNVYKDDCESIGGEYYIIDSDEHAEVKEKYKEKYEEATRGGGDWNGVDNTIGEDLSKSLMNNEDKNLEA